MVLEKKSAMQADRKFCSKLGKLSHLHNRNSNSNTKPYAEKKTILRQMNMIPCYHVVDLSLFLFSATTCIDKEGNERTNW